MFPLQINIKFSKESTISELGWWMVEITLTPLLLKDFNNSITYKEVELSRPVVGSSKKIMAGLVSNSTPIEVLFLSPPEIPLIIIFPILESLHFYKPNSFIKV